VVAAAPTPLPEGLTPQTPHENDNELFNTLNLGLNKGEMSEIGGYLGFKLKSTITKKNRVIGGMW